MKKTLLLFTFLFLLQHAKIEASCYLPPFSCSLNFFGAANWAQVNGFNVDVDAKVGYMMGAGLGAELGCCSEWLSYTRIEAEYSFRQNRLKRLDHKLFDIDLHGTVSTNCWMLDLYQGIPIYRCYVVPFVGVGVGYAYHNTLKEVQVFSGVEDRKRGFAWQVIAGFTTPVNVATLLSIEYRFLNCPQKLYQQSVGLSVRYLY